MERLTKKENGKAALIKGNFDFGNVKQGIERLCEFEDWIEKSIGDFSKVKLGDLLVTKKTKNSLGKKETFRPYLFFDDDRIEFFNFFENIFNNKKVEIENKFGYIGERTKMVDSNNKELLVGDVVLIEDLENSFDAVVRFVGCEKETPFIFGFHGINIFENSRFLITKVKSCKELRHKEKYGPVIAILKEEE